MSSQLSPLLLQDPSTFPQVQLAYTQLHSVIDNLDSHVQQLIRRHQSQFILAYRNHLIKVKDELAILKKKSEEQERMTSGVTKINKLERQVALFREEALKVYTKLEDKNKEYQEYKAKYIEADEGNQRNQEMIKELSRRLKVMEIRNKEMEGELMMYRQQQQQNTEQNHQQRPQQPSKPSKPISSHKSMRMTGTISSSTLTIQSILKSSFPTSTPQSLYLASSQLQKLIKQRQDILTTRLQNYKHKQLMAQIVDSSAMTNDLKQWFLECIKTVKKEILKRNPNVEKERKEVDNGVKSMEEFLRIDRLRLLELFVSDERLLSIMYGKMFPDRMGEIREWLGRKKTEEENGENVKIEDEEEWKEHIEEIEKPKVVLPKVKKQKESVGNRVIIKGGKLNLNH